MKVKLLIFLLLTSHIGLAATITWDGGAGTANWTDAANWSGNTLPSVLDSVVISNDSVNLSSTTTIQSLELTNNAIFIVATGATLSISNSPSIGMSVGISCKIYNLGLLKITNPDILGISIFFGEVHNYGDLIIENTFVTNGSIASGIELIFSASLDNYISGEIKLLQLRNTGIVSDPNCTINNFGSIIMEGTTSGINSRGLFHNHVSGNFQLYTKNTAISLTNLNSQLVNQGYIKVDSVQSNGAALYATAGSISNAGAIYLNNVPGNGLTVSLSATLTNTGSININNCNTGAYFSGDYTLGTGTLNISNATSVGINHNGILNNVGTLNISNTGTFSISSGASNFNNFGSLFINNSGNTSLFNIGILLNQGDIFINTTSSALNAIEVINEGSMTIAKSNTAINAHSLRNSGIISIDSSRIGISAFLLVNENCISIDSAGLRGISVDSLLRNEGDLIINNAVFGIWLETSSEFLNSQNSIITIAHTSNGINDIGASKLTNHGTMHFDTCTLSINLNHSPLLNSGSIQSNYSQTNGLRLNSDASTPSQNTSSGQIIIDNANSYGISINHNFINDGVIEINNCEGTSLNCNNSGGTDTLQNSGIIKVTNSTTTSLFFNDHTLINTGILELENCQFTFNFNTQDPVFENEYNGSIITNSRFLFAPFPSSSKTTTSSSYINEGLITQNSITQNSFTSFVNNGVFVDLKNIISALESGFTQNGILIKPIRGLTSNKIKERSIIYRHPQATWEVDKNWYNGKTIFPAQFIGTYSISDNSFKPTVSAVGSFRFDVSRERPDFNHTIVLNREESPCPMQAIIQFTQDISFDWFDPMNWSVGIVPDGCSKVLLNNTKATIESGSKARVKNIQNVGTGTWEAESGAVLEIGF